MAFFNVKSSRHRCAPTVLEVNASRTFPRFKSAFVFVGHLPDICGCKSRYTIRGRERWFAATWAV